VTAPIASGWSGCRVGLAPTGKRRLFTAHAKSRPHVARIIGLKGSCPMKAGRWRSSAFLVWEAIASSRWQAHI